jgi:hypothetical protein
MENIDNPTDQELIARALNLWGNWIETGNIILSAEDAQQRKLKFNALSVDQMKLVVRLRELATAINAA